MPDCTDEYRCSRQSSESTGLQLKNTSRGQPSPGPNQAYDCCQHKLTSYFGSYYVVTGTNSLSNPGCAVKETP